MDLTVRWFLRSLVRRRRLTMWRWRALYISTLMLLSRPSRTYCKKGETDEREGCSLRDKRCFAFTHAVQVVPGLIARCKQGEGAFAFDLLSDARPVGVFLGCQSPHELQSAVHVVNGSHCGERRETENALCSLSGKSDSTDNACQVNIYLQDILACRLASCTQDSTHRELHFAPHKKRNEDALLDVLSEKTCYHFYLVIYLMQTMQSNITTGLQWMHGCRMYTCGQLSFPGPNVAVNKNLKKW